MYSVRQPSSPPPPSFSLSVPHAHKHLRCMRRDTAHRHGTTTHRMLLTSLPTLFAYAACSLLNFVFLLILKKTSSPICVATCGCTRRVSSPHPFPRTLGTRAYTAPDAQRRDRGPAGCEAGNVALFSRGRTLMLMGVLASSILVSASLDGPGSWSDMAYMRSARRGGVWGARVRVVREQRQVRRRRPCRPPSTRRLRSLLRNTHTPNNPSRRRLAIWPVCPHVIPGRRRYGIKGITIRACARLHGRVRYREGKEPQLNDLRSV